MTRSHNGVAPRRCPSFPGLGQAIRSGDLGAGSCVRFRQSGQRPAEQGLVRDVAPGNRDLVPHLGGVVSLGVREGGPGVQVSGGVVRPGSWQVFDQCTDRPQRLAVLIVSAAVGPTSVCLNRRCREGCWPVLAEVSGVFRAHRRGEQVSGSRVVSAPCRYRCLEVRGAQEVQVPGVVAFGCTELSEPLIGGAEVSNRAGKCPLPLGQHVNRVVLSGAGPVGLLLQFLDPVPFAKGLQGERQVSAGERPVGGVEPPVRKLTTTGRHGFSRLYEAAGVMEGGASQARQVEDTQGVVAAGLLECGFDGGECFVKPTCVDQMKLQL